MYSLDKCEVCGKHGSVAAMAGDTLCAECKKNSRTVDVKVTKKKESSEDGQNDAGTTN
jgi:hypothetical protein